MISSVTKPVWIIAKNTYREIIRDRILYGIIVFALLLIGMSIALGELSFAEQARISANFGFAGIQLSACILAVFVGSSLVSKEIEKQTILTLLARPITRTQFLSGKFLGLTFVILTVMAGLAVVLAALVASLELAIDGTFAVALYGIVLEALILLGLALLFGSFARPMMTVTFTAALFLIGHWVGSLRFFMKTTESETFRMIGRVIVNVVPDLERFNWRAAPVYQIAVPGQEVFATSVYALGWIFCLVAATSLIFRKRDFV
ncbi:MAG: ABC transporter permease [Bdellovibrionaceae bacterium]|nr:ABC transporter permease [Pseudobdellovibrionaceae bacterium]